MAKVTQNAYITLNRHSELYMLRRSSQFMHAGHHGGAGKPSSGWAGSAIPAFLKSPIWTSSSLT